MKGGKAQDYPEYEDDEKQEAARFLCSDFTSVKGHNASEEDHLHAGPMIRGISEIERLNKWTEVKKDLGSRVQKDDREALQRRRRELTTEEAVEFQLASQTDAGQQAVADGGVAVEEDEEADDGDGDEWEPREGQQVVQYEDEADRESQKRDAASVATMFDDADAVAEKISEERDSDRVRPHVIDALQDRMEELKQ